MKHTDVDLIQQTLAGDETAFAELVKKYQKPVHTLAWRQIGDFQIAEEITQDTFLKVYQRLHTLKNPNQLFGWLYVIVTRRCYAWLRKKRIRTDPLEDVETTMAPKDAYSEHVIDDRRNSAVDAHREAVKKLLAKLKESERTVMTLHYLGGMTVEEISKFIGVSSGTIKSRLQRARNRLQKEETMIREALEHFQISPNLTDNIMKEISRTKQIAPTSGKPLIPWIVGVTTLTIVLLMLGFSNQYLSRFQKPYNFNAVSEMKVELIDTPIVQNLEADPDNRTQSGNVNGQGKNNGSDQQINNVAPVDLETIITKLKHYDNAVTSATGEFLLERHRNYKISGNPIIGNLSIERNIEPQIEKIEYKLTFEGEKVRVDGATTGFGVIQYWDGKQHWEVSLPSNLLFKLEIPPNKESTHIEKIIQAFKQVGIEFAEDVRIVPGELPDSFRIIDEKDKTYFVMFVGESMLEVYKHNVGYAVRSHWIIRPYDGDPRWWLTFPSDGSDNTYLFQPLWQLLEKHESEIIGTETLNGENTTVIHLTKPGRTFGDHNTPPRHLKLWISHDKGFRLVKSEEEYVENDPSNRSPFIDAVRYIKTREIDYHEYQPDVWFPNRIEMSIVPKTSSGKQNGGKLLFKDIFTTKQCLLNTDVSQLLRLDLSPDTLVTDFTSSGRMRQVGGLEIKPDFLTQPNSDNVPNKRNNTGKQVSESNSHDFLQQHLPKGAKTQFGKGRSYDIAYSPDGTRLAVASSIGVWIYDAHSGQELDLLTGHTAKVFSITFSPDGKILASTGKDNTVRIWDARTGTHLRTITGHENSTTGLMFSPDGKILASAGKDNIIRMWDMRTETTEQTLIGHTDTIFNLWFSSNGSTLTSAGKDNTIRIWNIRLGTLEKTQTLVENTEQTFEMAFSMDGRTLASWGWEGPIRLWDVETGKLRHAIPLQLMDVVNEFAFSPNGNILASAMNNGIVYLWNAQTGKHHRILLEHTHYSQNVVFSPDGNTIVSGSYDSTICLWDAQTGKLQKTLTGHWGDITCVAFSPDGNTIANAIDTNTIHLLDVKTGKLRSLLKIPDMFSIMCVAFNPDGKILASGDNSSAVHLWNTETGTVLKTLAGHKDYVTSVVFSTDGSMLASSSWDKTVHLYDIPSGELRRTFSGHLDIVTSVAFSSDDKTLASGSKDGTVRIWDVQTGELRKSLTGHTGNVSCVMFNSNGTLASGSYDSLIHLWDIKTGKILISTEHKDWIKSIAFRPDGRILASIGKDGSNVHLWDTHTDMVQQFDNGHSDRLTCVLFSPDGNTLASGSKDGTILLWVHKPKTTPQE